MRLQVRHLLLSWAVSCTCSIALAPPAQAQSFFQKLFGFGSSAPAPDVRVQGRTIPNHRFHSRRFYQRPEPPEEDEFGPPDSGGPYRTMCVRACDGFYFPLRNNAMRRNFSSDVKSCRSACGDEARLYYYPENGGSVDTMTDLAGRAYKDMPQAFAYRKTLVSGCTCKPAPWSREEAARHLGYAVAEADARSQSVPPLPQSSAQPAPTLAPEVPRPVLADEAKGDEAPPEATDTNAASEAQVAAIAEAEPAAATITPAPGFQRAERPQRRKSKSRLSRAKYVPTSPGLFGNQKSSLTWPGD